MEVVSKLDFELLQEIVKEQQQAIERLQAKLAHVAAEPSPWLIQSEANKLFIGRGGEPVDRHTFRNWILRWMAEGKLIEGKNMMTNIHGKFISKDFLKGQFDYKTKLKKAA